jgi:antitoxin component YwqK of YwqJK toxin-antitoxin module
LNKLSKVSGNLNEMIKLTQQEAAKSAINSKKEMIFEDEDGFEVFEVDNDDRPIAAKTNTVQTVNENTKIRPNDKVTAKYEDGKMAYDIKYKKIKMDVEAGKCKILSINLD